MKIIFASDHAGFHLKGDLVSFVRDALGYEVEDKGAYEYDQDDDYPDFVAPAAYEVSQNPTGIRALVIGGSGQGEAIMSNRFPRVRAVVFNGQFTPEDGRKVPDEIRLSREHNDANILSLGARFLSLSEAKEATEKWLEIPYVAGERHGRRLQKIDEITKEIHNL